jgi:hypothetical protein
MLNDTVCYDIQTVESVYNFVYDIIDDKPIHNIKFILSGKTDSHTVINDSKVVSSAQVTLSNISLDDMDIKEIFIKTHTPPIATYTHSYNGYGKETIGPFDFCLGYNGVVEFEFSTPVYQWIIGQYNL